MKTPLLRKTSISIAAILLAATSSVFAQTDENQIKKVNFRYSQNPKTKSSNNETVSKKNENEVLTSPNVESEKIDTPIVAKPSIAKKTLEVARKSATNAIAPTEIYKVGIGDVLFINLQNAPKSSTYYTVLNDGTIDYPLAGEMVSVNGLTTEEIENVLLEKVKLFENPQISVKVREYSSHNISVIGLVELAGEKKIQREAIPLFVVRAEAIVQPKATKAIIRRADSKTETIELKYQTADNVLIFSGDIVEFIGDNAEVKTAVSGFYYIGGEIINGGQKDFHSGLTLTQAILASGGLKKNVKKVVIRRKNSEGLLEATEYNLKSIKEGKNPDPVILIGDTIEIGM